MRLLFRTVAVCVLLAPTAQGYDHFSRGQRSHGGGSGGGGFSSGWSGGFSNFGFYRGGRADGFTYYRGPVGGFGYGYYDYPGYGPFGYTSFGYPNYGPYYSYIPMAPIVQQAHPIWIGQDPFDNPVIQEWMPPAGQQQAKAPAGNAPAAQPRQGNVRLFVKPTTVEAKRKSIRYQSQGDEWFAKQNYLQAYTHYKQALTAAGDRPEARFRMALALAALSSFDLAVDEIKRGLTVDPLWPVHGDRLDEVFGAGNNLAKVAVLHRTAGWVREDVRDPNRLFLMGVLLHFNDDPDQAKPFLETANLLAGNPPHVQAFLVPVERAEQAPPAQPPQPAPVSKQVELPAPGLVEDDEPPAPPRPQARARGPKLLVPGVAVPGDE